MTPDGEDVAIEAGDTLLSVAQRRGVEIPTLCHDPRLDPAGACRTCLVEVEGQRRLLPSCATKALPGMVVTTSNERIARHRRTLFELYLSDHAAPADGDGASDELERLARDAGALGGWPKLPSIRAARPNDRNRFIEFVPELCILCARCTRYCDEVEGVTAITLAGRGSRTTISTADAISLLDSTCEMCGGCIDTCPTGAMTEKLPRVAAMRAAAGSSATSAVAAPSVASVATGSPSAFSVDGSSASAAVAAPRLEKVRTTCNYCGVGCQLDLNVSPTRGDEPARVVKVTSPPPGTPPNDGNLCVKGRFAYEFIHHADRLRQPLVRAEDGRLVEASWEEAMLRVARGLAGVKERRGADALAFVSSSRCTMEENYLVQKLARAVFETNNVHQCAAT